MQGEDSVGTGRGGIQIVRADRLVHLTLEEAVQGFLLRTADLLGEAADGNTAALVVRDLQVLVFVDLACAFVGQQVSNLLIVDLSVTDPDCDSLIEFIRGE